MKERERKGGGGEGAEKVVKERKGGGEDGGEGGREEEKERDSIKHVTTAEGVVAGPTNLHTHTHLQPTSRSVASGVELRDHCLEHGD